MTNEVAEAIDATELPDADVTDVADEVEVDQSGEEPDSDSSTETKSEQEDSDEEKKASGKTARIDELTRLRRTAERQAEQNARERDYWRDQALQKQQNDLQPEAEAEGVKTLEDFDYDQDKYNEYMFTRARQGAVEEARRVLAEEQKAQSQSQKIAAFRSQEAEFSKGIDDYAEVTQNPDLNVSTHMAQIIPGMESGPEVLYYLGKNPDVSEQIARLDPMTAAIELGRISERLGNKPAKKVSDAPAPTPKLKAGNPNLNVKADSPDSDKISTEEWLKRRNKQIMR